MTGNFHEIELRKALDFEITSKRIRVLGDSAPFFSQIMTNYPFSGSRIDWARVAHSVEKTEEDRALQEESFIIFFNEMVKKYNLSGDVIYIGDSLTNFALSGSLSAMADNIADILDIPQHHYFIGADNSWCICTTMEGDMGFGFRPSGTRR